MVDDAAVLLEIEHEFESLRAGINGTASSSRARPNRFTKDIDVPSMIKTINNLVGLIGKISNSETQQKARAFFSHDFKTMAGSLSATERSIWELYEKRPTVAPSNAEDWDSSLDAMEAAWKDLKPIRDKLIGGAADLDPTFKRRAFEKTVATHGMEGTKQILRFQETGAKNPSRFDPDVLAKALKDLK